MDRAEHFVMNLFCCFWSLRIAHDSVFKVLVDNDQGMIRGAEDFRVSHVQNKHAAYCTTSPDTCSDFNVVCVDIYF